LVTKIQKYIFWGGIQSVETGIPEIPKIEKKEKKKKRKEKKKEQAD
jgi:hypothetical protein